MTEFKKTQPQGTPGAAVYPIVTPAGQKPQGPPPKPERAPSNRPPPSSEIPRNAVVDTGPSKLPPEPTQDELRETRAPEGSRTPSADRTAPNFGPPLPENAPGWMLRARRMSLALEEAIAAGTATESLEASIERAFVAWELCGSRDKRIAHVARLVEKAHTAIRETAPADLERAFNECSQVIWAGLPRKAKSRQDFGEVMLVVRALRAEADPWAAVVSATARLLGWTGSARAHSAHAVRVAILSEHSNG